MVAYVQILPSACLAGYENDGYADKYLTRAKTIPPHTRAIFFLFFLLPLIKFLVPVSFAAHSRVTFYSPDFRFFDRELARSL